MSDVPRCPCGWSHASLTRDIAKEEQALHECGKSGHPFRGQMADGIRRRLETLRAHLEGSGCSRSRQSRIDRLRRWRVENS